MKVTGTVTAVPPLAVTNNWPMCVPADRPETDALIRTLAGVEPLAGDTVSQDWLLATVNVRDAPLVLEMAMRLDGGSPAPAVALNDNVAGETDTAGPAAVKVRVTGMVLVVTGAPVVEMVTWLV